MRPFALHAPLVSLALAASVVAAPFVPVTTVPAGDGPNASVVAMGGQMLVVANSDTHDLTRIDLETLRPLAPVPVGQVPTHIELSDDGRTAYVACFRGKSLAFVDVAEGRLLRSVDLGVTPRGLARVGDTLVVAGYYEGVAVTVDATSGEITGRLTLAKSGLTRVLPHPDGTRAYILNTSRDAIYEVGVRPLELRAQLGAELGYMGNWDMVMSPDAQQIVISQWVGDRVAVLSTEPLAVTGFVETQGDGPCALAFTPDGTYVVVAHSESDDAGVVNVERMHLRAVLPVGPFPFSDVHVTADGAHALVTADNARKLAVLDLNKLETVGHVATGRIPHVITGDASGRLYVSNVSGKSVTVVDPTGAEGERFVALHREYP